MRPIYVHHLIKGRENKMNNGKKVTAIILVAGNSTRYGQNRNKNFEVVQGKTILDYSLDEFGKNEKVDDIIIATKESEFENVQNIVDKHNLSKSVKIVKGGASRQESVYNCINNTKSDIVIIHDGARPAIKQEYIDKCIDSMDEFKGVTIGVKSKDTIKLADDNGVVKQTTQRKNTWLIQTPQCFERETLLDAHNKFKNDESITDDCMLLEKTNNDIKIIEGDYSNIKVTTFDDLKLINEFLK